MAKQFGFKRIIAQLASAKAASPPEGAAAITVADNLLKTGVLDDKVVLLNTAPVD